MRGSENVAQSVAIRFRIENRSEEYAKVGNFLRKYKQGLQFDKSDLFNTSRAEIDLNRSIKMQLDADYKDLNPEQAPLLHTYLPNYRLRFFIEIDGADVTSSTVTNFQHLFLILLRFFDLDVYCLVRTKGNGDAYFYLSHYFALLNIEETFRPEGMLGDNFYDRVLVDDGKSTKRLQRKNIGALKAFLPLIPICKKNVE